jgi:hypothetical protein
MEDVFSRIGFGRYQIRLFVVLALGGLAFGTEMSVFAILPIVLKEEWGLSDL